MPLTPFIPWLLALASCSSPPQPPTVDESRKRPVNSQMAVELQVCRNDLQNTRLLATESGRLAETTAATLANVAARQQVLASLREPAEQPPAARGQPQPQPQPQPEANSVFTVRFAFGSTRVVVAPDLAPVLIEHARVAPLVLLRGRTDGATDAPAESRIARERAAAVRDYLVAAGVDPARIRATYQPAGDHVADNASAGGRALNRRVEIELYRALPVAMSSLGTTALAQP
jgi:outer membrane protein OmpA-like peptidoglycan-associated protein